MGAAPDRARLRGQVRPHAGSRFRHAAVFQRWRPDKPPADCRYDQLEVTTAYELEKVFGAIRAALIHALPIVGRIVRIERFLRRPQLLRHVLQVHADARPGVKPAAHGIDEHVGGREVRGGLGVTRLPALETGERIRLFAARARSRSADASRPRPPRPGGADGWTRARFTRLLLVVRRPRRIAQPVALVRAPTARAGGRASTDARRWPRAGRRPPRSAPASSPA